MSAAVRREATPRPRGPSERGKARSAELFCAADGAAPVTPSTLASWRESFMESGLAGLTKKAKDPRDEQIANLQRKLGAVTMDNELLNAKIDRMEAGLPLVPRWLKT